MPDHRKAAGTITHAPDHLTLFVGDMMVTVAPRKAHEHRSAQALGTPVANNNSLPGTARRMSDEHRAKISASQKARWAARRESLCAS